MIIQFFSRHQRMVALSLLLVMYAQLALPVHAQAREWDRNMMWRYLSSSSTTYQRTGDPGKQIAMRSPVLAGAGLAYLPEESAPAVKDIKVEKPVVSQQAIADFGGGPTQPEMQSFQSVNSNNMVDLFTGDFSYNIPLMDVGGYPINIHYSSGITMDQEASWVGLGWNINPGTITRNMRGLPDDFNGQDQVTKTMNIKKNKTIGVTGGANVELFGGSLALSASIGAFHNTYKGWGTETGINAGINAGSSAGGGLTFGLGVTNNSQSGLDISPSLSFRMGASNDQVLGIATIGTNYNSRTGISGLQMSGEISQQYTNDENQRKNYRISSFNTGISFSKPSFTPSVTIPFTSSQYGFRLRLGGEIVGLHPNGFISGYGSVQQIAEEDKSKTMPAYGYLYYQNANGNPDVLLDFNREKEMAFREKEPHIAVPMYTYDSYCINGEGTGGMFRPYRGDIGFIYDHAMSTKSNSTNFAVDLGFGGYFHGGLDYNGIFANTKNSAWLGDNIFKDAIPFKSADSTFEPVYFKNPGEKTSVDQAFYDAIGDTKLMRVDLSPLSGQNSPTVTATKNLSLFQNALSTSKISFPNNSVYRKQRDKRTQVISYLNASQATFAGLDKQIKSYGINQFPGSGCNNNYTPISRVDDDNLNPAQIIRKRHHLSEISVLNNDGRRYVYGIPVYNLKQQDASFAVSKKLGSGSAYNLRTGQIQYNKGLDNSTRNDKGIDNYFNEETVPSYAHSFLLSGILSPDYVDITGDGITEDDNGEAIKFNYTRVYGGSSSYKWRAPFDSAAYNEGLKADNRDEKASYSYGEREVWYLNSVESKTMMATFVLDVQNERKDGHGVTNVDGGIDTNAKLYRLKEINLYSKADYVKNGAANAKPIKTVHFCYSYDLCKKNPSSTSDSGKLTLTKIWFSYNKNEKGQLNPYVFTYHSNNPNYLKGAVDRWGNFKDSRNNPQQLSNADYSYTLQCGQSNSWDSAKAANDVSAWNLSKVKLPSGGELRVTYESDDYAYVQNRRAMQMFTIAGFGANYTDAPSSHLYTAHTNGADYNYVFIRVTQPVYSKDEIRQKYLEGVNKLYFKLFVKMPTDVWGGGGEFVPFYADIDGANYGIKGSPSDKIIWIKLAPVDGGGPAAVAALQFLRLNLPSKAYPMSEPGDDVDAADFVKMLASAVSNIGDAVSGYASRARKSDLCNYISVDSSFVRMDNPVHKKFGGGLRVKKIEVFDNFKAMSKQQQSDATYGQEYDYSTIKKINNVSTRISSGVAAYEPAIGGEENPFHQPVEYVEKVAPLAPSNYLYTEEPLGETYFPGPMVGYSKVSVRTINKNQKSATGTEQTEFYTTYDFPTLWEFTPLDNESKKTYNPTIRNLFKFFARHDVTLSQGFKVEMNDMNGKIKSQSSYSQTDSINPISYTYNYYKVDNEATSQKHLAGNVAVMDSANGKVNLNGQMGKDVEIMVDMREQTSKTIFTSVESNIDVVAAVWFPIIFGSMIPIPSSETNRYRSIGVMKVVNRYGILDSVVHIEKGSKVSTKNMVYDSETGEVVLSRTNNEFDDPVYNFVYPAHWAYTGMGPAYRNIGASFTNLQFRQGKLFNAGAGTDFNTAKFFESGDELVVRSPDIRNPLETDSCSPAFYNYVGDPSCKKIWALDAGKGKEGHQGMYFIDKNGIPFSTSGASIYVLRSGKRNMSSTPIGSVTSLVNPIRTVSGVPKIVFDTSSKVIAASAAKFTDFWRVDSTSFRKDTVITTRRLADSTTHAQFPMVDMYSLRREHQGSNTGYYIVDTADVRTYSYDNGGSGTDYYQKTWMRFDITTALVNPIPQNSLITSANIFLYNSAYIPGMAADLNQRGSSGSNQSYLHQTRGPWIANYNSPEQRDSFFNEHGYGATNSITEALINATTPNVNVYRSDTINVTGIVQGMVDEYYNTSTTVNGVVLGLKNTTGDRNGSWSQIVYTKNYLYNHAGNFLRPFIQVNYCLPCATGAKAYWSTSPSPGYYCDDLPKDTFLCRPNIVDSAVNPYRWGIFGNWRMTRTYTYYDNRLQSDPSSETDLRKDGEITAFQPYWNFTSGSMSATTDTSRWVWNSEMTLFNRKGYEIENKDPLNRYNSGQYGYNQHMPVAVGQNAHNREMMFDGFEDYGYKTDTCIKCTTPRFIDLAGGGGSLVDTISHTGKYSLRVGGSQSTSTTIKIATGAEDSLAYSLSTRFDTTLRISTSVYPNGTGLAANVFTSGNQVTPCTTLLGSVDYDWNQSSPNGACGSDYYNIVWNGKIQPKYTGRYYLMCTHDDYVNVKINGVSVLYDSLHAIPLTQYDTSTGVDMEAGKLYTISITYTELINTAYVKLKWMTKDGQQTSEIIPSTNFYPITATDSSIASTVQHDTTYCVYARSPKPKKLTLDRFSPLQGKQMVFTAWVKEEQACVSGNYQNDQVVLTFNGGSTTTITVKPKGRIIEGWQRIEEFITIPSDATSMTVSMQATSGSIPVYFDDVRMHPFNSNLKSFVYNPVNLRLMAELDENNYATFYEYDDDGTLIRLKKETERGIKTIKETRSALQKL